ncbi:MAG: FAD-dependent oxidoreductase [Proteobacteria bacterium]|nr:FAD-dependent oxidoreductase [Burkholderiales bacterium]
MTTHDITVIGAGIVGVAVACYLQRDGHRVTLIDRGPPGEFTSKGNAGILSPGSVVPLGMPGVLKKVPQWLTDPAAPLSIKWRRLPYAAPWLWRFIRASRRARVEEIADALRPLLGQTFEAYRTLTHAAGCADLINQSGYIAVYESEASFRGDALAWSLRRDRGVRVEDIDAARIRELDPDLAPIYVRGVLLPEQGYVANPLWLTQRLFKHFVESGGRYERRQVTGFEIGPDGPRALDTDLGALPVDRVVLAAGIFSAGLAAQLGTCVPLESQRGYHVHFPEPGISPRTPVMSGDYKFFTTPMADGLRNAGTVEIAGLDAPPTQARIDALVRHTKRMYPGARLDDMQTWMGHRPCTPDSLPVIGRSERFANVFFAFGHGHTGLCGAAPTGRLIADLVAARTPNIDPTPYRATRF